MAGQTNTAQTALDQEKWDSRYGARDYVPKTRPVAFLEERLGQLPRGRALGLAAGAGRNEVYLARQGYDVTAVDVSPLGLEHCRRLALQHCVSVTTVVADLRTYDLGLAQWDLITSFYYYEPELLPRVMPALRPGGVFLLQTYSMDELGRPDKPRNPAYLIRPNALLEVFRGYRIRYYEDAVVPGDYRDREEAVVRLIVENTPVGEAAP